MKIKYPGNPVIHDSTFRNCASSRQKTSWTRASETAGTAGKTPSPGPVAATGHAKDKYIVPKPGWNEPAHGSAMAPGASVHSMLTPDVQAVQGISAEAAAFGGFNGIPLAMLENAANPDGGEVSLIQGSHRFQDTPGGGSKMHFHAFFGVWEFRVDLQQAPNGKPYVTSVVWGHPETGTVEMQNRKNPPPVH